MGVFVHSTNACPMCCRGYSSIGRILAPYFGEGIRPWDEYLPHVLGRCWRGYSSPCFGEGICPWDEYLPLVLERVFVQRTNTCLMIWRWYSSTDECLPPVVERVFVSRRRIVWTTRCEYFWGRMVQYQVLYVRLQQQ